MQCRTKRVESVAIACEQYYFGTLTCLLSGVRIVRIEQRYFTPQHGLLNMRVVRGVEMYD